MLLVMTLIRQRDLYLRAIVALSAAPPGGLTLRECAAALEAYDSSVRQALLRLVDDGVVSASGARYALKETRRTELELERAQFELDAAEMLRLAVRSNPAVELAAFDARARTLHLLTDPAAEPSAVVRLREAIGRVPDIATRERSSAEVLGTTVEDVERRRALRTEIARARLLKGDVDKALPLRQGPRRRARPLGRLHPSLPPPSRREKQRLARRYELDEISVFGSATRSDFRPDSDVDTLVHFRGGAVPTMGSYAALARDLGDVMDRRVDVVDADAVDSAFIPAIERDRVTLYGRAHTLVPREGAPLRGAGDRRPLTSGRRLGRRSRQPRGPDAPRRGGRRVPRSRPGGPAR